MSEMQKIIKYFAVAFALCLAFSIISSIMYAIFSFGTIFGSNHKNHESLHGLKIDENASVLDIDITGTNLVIKEGDRKSVV